MGHGNSDIRSQPVACPEEVVSKTPPILISKSRIRILLVDDEFDITFTFKKGLEDNGFEVDSFNDPQIAL
ncbi:MAG: hypothetical protein WA364_09565, partial [Candidatus Nitrosopolaris sp.]